MLSLLAESAAINAESTITLAMAILGGGGLIGLGSWSAILRHRQDDHGRQFVKLEEKRVAWERQLADRFKELEDRLLPLEDAEKARAAVRVYKEQRAKRMRSDAPRVRPDESSA